MARFLIATLMTDGETEEMHLANVEVAETEGRSTAAIRRGIAIRYLNADEQEQPGDTVLVIQIDSSVAPEAFRLRPTTVLDTVGLPASLDTMYGPAATPATPA